MSRAGVFATSETTARRRPPAVVLRGWLLNVAAVLGALCLAAMLAAWLFQISIILFKTGSMAPTIPAGSAALVREVPAEELRPGDVVTVERPGRLPVTHRVVSAEPAGGGLTSLVLRGDANQQDDPAPYLVDRSRIVLFAVPGLAALFVAWSQPPVLGAMTLLVAALVAWVLWPSRARR